MFKLGFSSETEPKGVPTHAHIVGTKFCLPKRQDSGLQCQYYSSPLWPLSRFEKYESHCQIVSIFVLEQGYKVKHVLTTKENSTLEDSTDCLLKGQIEIMDGQTLRSSYLHFADSFTHVHLELLGSKTRLWKTGPS